MEYMYLPVILVDEVLRFEHPELVVEPFLVAQQVDSRTIDTKFFDREVFRVARKSPAFPLDTSIRQQRVLYDSRWLSEDV
jgi:hypothetical protein